MCVLISMLQTFQIFVEFIQSVKPKKVSNFWIKMVLSDIRDDFSELGQKLVFRGCPSDQTTDSDTVLTHICPNSLKSSRFPLKTI